MIVDVDFQERYWYPDDGGEVWVSGYQLIDADGRFIGRGALPERLIVAWVAGAVHRPSALTSDHAAPGKALTLRPEPSNEHDPHAVAVDLASGEPLGYVPREFAPRVMLVNFWDMDIAHWGSYSLYLQAIDKTDRLTGMLWDEVQSNPKFKDNTTLLVLPELGRDGDMNAANGFLNHRSGDASCRNIWMLAMGAGVTVGETERPIHHVDVAATAAEVLGVKTGELAGNALKEILV